MLVHALCHAQSYSVVANFGTTTGVSPAGITQGADGSFYGVTEGGGSAPQPCGTVFQMTPNGTLNTLHSFSFAEGCFPFGGLVQATDGSLYGVTEAGGANAACPGGCGTVFKITPSGKLTTIYNFTGMADGFGPNSLVQTADGYFYGTATEALPLGPCPTNCGKIFRISPSGDLFTMHTFNGTDGATPRMLTQAKDGNLYGTTLNGGIGTVCMGGCGTVFKLTLAGTFTTLYNFGTTGFTDGWSPSPIMQGPDGDFYGTTLNGGDTTNMEGIVSGVGTVFKITSGGVLSTLHRFNLVGGAFPYNLTPASDGNYYGTTTQGGVPPAPVFPGTVFKITPGGTLTTLHMFGGASDGSGLVVSPMIQAKDGNLYGTSLGVGKQNHGTVFCVAVGLSCPSSSSSPMLKVTINGPADGSKFTAGSTISISATTQAPATPVTVSHVDFFANGQSIGLGSQATESNTYSANWIPGVAGSYQLTAVVTASDQSTANSSTINVQITAAQPLTVQLFDPLPGSLFTVGQSINVQALISLPSGGPPAQVQFIANGASIGMGSQEIGNGYAISWSPSNSGQYSLTAVATDFQNNTWTSDSIVVAFNPPAGPAVGVISPAQSQFNPGDTVQLSATASSMTSTIQQVEFFVNGGSIGTGNVDAQGNYDKTWTAGNTNIYSVFAQSTDANANVSASQPITLYVGLMPMTPLVAITSPTDGSTLTLDNPITFAAIASALGGATVSAVNFYANGSWIGTAAPTTAADGRIFYGFTWTNASPGSYGIIATAIDLDNRIGSSSGIGVTIQPGSVARTGQRAAKHN